MWIAGYCSLLPSMIAGSLAGSDDLTVASAFSKSAKVFSEAGSTPASRSFATLANTPVVWPLWAMP